MAEGETNSVSLDIEKIAYIYVCVSFGFRKLLIHYHMRWESNTRSAKKRTWILENGRPTERSFKDPDGSQDKSWTDFYQRMLFGFCKMPTFRQSHMSVTHPSNSICLALAWSSRPIQDMPCQRDPPPFFPLVAFGFSGSFSTI